MKIVAIIASIGVAIQTLMSLYGGSSICPTQGCRIVETLTVVRPFWFNLLGLVFFQAVFWSLKKLKDWTFWGIDPVGMLLLGGLTFDGVLLAYQVFVAQTFCLYCLTVFAFVLILNLMYGRRQSALSLTGLAVILFSFSLLSFSIDGHQKQTYSLRAAAYAVRSCSAPTREVYLIFSSTCPHCQKVIQSLDECNSCDLYLNPIDPIDHLDLADVQRIDSFAPQVNRAMLDLLEIDAIPVLVAKGNDSYDIIRGEDNILKYLQKACFTDENFIYLDRSIAPGQEGITAFSQDSGECAVSIDCPEEGK